MEDVWSTLNDPDAAKAHQAMLTLTSAPKEAVDFLARRVQPVQGKTPDKDAIDRFIAELESDDFKTRDSASKELEKAGASAIAALEKALQAKPQPEQKRRIENILTSLSEAGAASKFLRPGRALEVLERIATPEARRLLEGLAEGQADAHLTREAKTALARLGKQAGGNP